MNGRFTRCMPVPLVKCVPGFRWPLIGDFAAPVDACRFNVGDLIHDDPRAYVLPWADARKLLTRSIQVKEASGRAADGADAGSAFESNWAAPMVVELWEHRTNRRELIACQQGQLYSALWQNETAALRSSLPAPPPRWKAFARELAKMASPIGWQKGMRTQAPLHWTFLLAGDAVAELVAGKVDRLTQALHAIDPKVRVSWANLETFGAAFVDRFAPTTGVFAFSFRASGEGDALASLKAGLYLSSHGGKGEGFNLNTHGKLLVPRSSGSGRHAPKRRTPTVQPQELFPLKLCTNARP